MTNRLAAKNLWIWLLLLYSACTTLFIAANSTKVKALAAGIRSAPQVEASPYQTEMYAHLARRDRNIRTPYVLFLGDSLTQAMPISQITAHAENFGVGGDTSQQILTRLRKMQSIPLVQKAVVMAGTNDLNQGLSGTAENIGAIIQLFNATTPVMLLAIPPVGTPINHISNEQIRQLNKTLEKQCQERPRCSFINTTQNLSTPTGYLNEQYHIGDGIHLNSKGYAVLLNAIAAVQDKL